MRAPETSRRGLSARGLVVERAGRAVVHGVDLDVRPGAITALLGANGAGKSSLVLALAGALPAASGRISCDGASIANLRPHVVRRAGVAAIPEGHRVLSDLTVEENLRAAGSALARRDLGRALDEAFQTLPELVERRDTLAGSLSGGQQQMVVIAQAMISKPKYVLADEFSFGLAPIIVARLAPALTALAQNGVGVLLIEQFTQLALKLSQHVYVMDRGRFVFSGAPAALEERPDILHSAYLVQG